jgi:hypothetical protein
MRLWSVNARPAVFRLIAGEADLTDYQGNNDVPNMSGSPYYNINVACLDGVDIDELMAALVRYYDGRNDNWGARPAETRHL